MPISVLEVLAEVDKRVQDLPEVPLIEYMHRVGSVCVIGEKSPNIIIYPAHGEQRGKLHLITRYDSLDSDDIGQLSEVIVAAYRRYMGYSLSHDE